jgi:hypothetical protein
MEKTEAPTPLLSTNGQPTALTEPQITQLREQHLREQEAQMEQIRLSYIASRAAVEALRAEIQGK